MKRLIIVLMVEDDPDHMEIFAAYLRHNRFEVVCAHTIEDGQRLAAERRPDAIVTGIDFGGKPRGLELVARLAADPVTANIPVVVHTAFSDVWDRELRALKVPVVTKGQSPATLLAAIRGVLPVQH